MTDIPPEAPAPEQRSRLSRKWTLKIAIIALVLLGFGLWGLYDAMIAYPARGSLAAEHLEYQYLQQIIQDHREDLASIPNPTQRLAELEKDQATSAQSASDRALFAWLDQLRIIGKLEPASASTLIPRTDFRLDAQNQPIQARDPDQRLAALKTTGASQTIPPLSRWDILMQWIIVVAGVGFGAWLLFVIASAKAKVYRWNPSLQQLTLPGGAALLPQDIAEFDKRKWHKLFISLKVKPSHPQLGGKAIEIDLLRFEPVEEWVLAMEKTAFPLAEADAAEPASSEPASPAT